MAVETSFTSIQTVWESKGGGGGGTYSRGVLFWNHGEGCGYLFGVGPLSVHGHLFMEVQ